MQTAFKITRLKAALCAAAPALFGLSAITGTAQAQVPFQGFMDLQYLQADTDGGDDPSGISLELDGKVGGPVSLIVEYASVEENNVDLRLTDIGLAYHRSFGETESFEIVGALAYTNLQAGGMGVNVNDDGYSAALGANLRLGSRFELGARVRQIDLGGDSDEELAIEGSAVVMITDVIAGVIEYETFDEFGIDNIHAGVRFFFDKPGAGGQ